MKSFGGARPFIFVDPAHIAKAKSWLAGLQQPDGCIASVGKLFHNGMKVKGRAREQANSIFEARPLLADCSLFSCDWLIVLLILLRVAKCVVPVFREV